MEQLHSDCARGLPEFAHSEKIPFPQVDQPKSRGREQLAALPDDWSAYLFAAGPVRPALR
jgi:hypothetical protein